MTTPSGSPTTQDEGQPLTPAAEQVADETPILQFKAASEAQISAEIRRLERESKDFKAAFESHVGLKAQRQYKPEIDRLTAELAELKIEKRRLEIDKMTPEEIGQRFNTDPGFAREYAEVTHHKPAPAVTQEVDPTPQILEAVEELEGFARDNGLSDAQWNAYMQRVADGEFGNQNTPWQTSLRRLERVVTADIIKAGKEPPKTEEKPLVTNAALTRGGPDLSNGRAPRSATGSWPKSATAFNSLPRDQQTEILKSAEGREHVRKLQG